ncbi:hypothetical protein J7E88_35040 [Streptomyces sp. ISL-10]|uniref:hypothetical protein n=1 Tax=Streptomyces sp. ISL-10 TaxID=2819172 RepID=UPI001BE5E617|nr:hypothetical protein [Streptomyces sp. ISL-10]MBT2370348.1 hypothetical protein [Streptomyces sp. ISL-10]
MITEFSMLSKLTGSSQPAEPPTPPLRWYTALTVYRDPANPGSVARASDTLKARSLREATLLFLAKAEAGPPKLPEKDLSTWTAVRFDVSETGEHAIEEQERQRRAGR